MRAPPAEPDRVASLVLVLTASLAVTMTAGCGSSRTRSEDAGSSSPYGAACSATSPCAGSLSCVSSERFPGGYCSEVCDDGTCEGAGRCVDGYGARLCLAACDTSADCREGYQCWLGACRPPCASDTDCGSAGGTCEGGRCTGTECALDSECGAGKRCIGSRCLAGGGDGGTMLPEGTPCTGSSQCESGLCAPSFVGGFCTHGCTDRASCGDPTFACAPVPVDADGDGTADVALPACVASNLDGNFLAGSCSTSAECEAGACIEGQCTEACDDDSDCLPGQLCTTMVLGGVTDGSFLGCGYRAPAPGVEIDDIDLGPLRVSTGLPSSRVVFGVPSDAVSVTVVARQNAGELVPLSYIDVYAPDSTHLFSYTDLASYIDQPLRWFPLDSEQIIAMLVPNSTPDRLAFLPGRYGFTAVALARTEGDTATADLTLSARIKRAPGGVITGGVLDLNIFLVGVGVSASSAPSNARLQEALTHMGEILAAAGITLGSIQYVDVSSDDATRFAIIDSSEGVASEMSELFMRSGTMTNQAVDVFLVRGISDGAGERGGIALGIAGGVPGPPATHGTIHSGVLVSFDPTIVGSGSDGARIVAQIMSHEVGHYLGLFHNKESSRPCDTGEIPSETNPCAPFGGGDVLEDTALGDGANLMFFRLGGIDGHTYNVGLSPGQSYVLSRSAIVR